MPRAARLSIALILAIGCSALLAVGQLRLGSRTRVLDWHACFCDAGGDDSYLFIKGFIIWLQAMAILVGAMIGRLAVPSSQSSGRAATTVALTVAASVGALAGVPAAVREVMMAQPARYAPPNVTMVREAAITGVVLGIVAALGALRSVPALAGAALSWAWLWLVGLASTSRSGGHTAALGMLYGYPREGPGAFLADIIPLAVMAVITAGTAWWGAHRGGLRLRAMFAAMLGPTLVFATYLSAGKPIEHTEGLRNAITLMLMGMMAAAGGAAAGALRSPRRHGALDALIIILAIAGILSTAALSFEPLVNGPFSFISPVAGTLLVAALFTLPILPAVTDTEIDSRREQIAYSPYPEADLEKSTD